MLDLYIMRRRAARSMRLHIAEFPKQFMLFEGFPSDCCSRHGGGPMIGTRCAATALILAASLASVAFAQQQPAKPAATPQPAKPAATPQPAKPAAAPAKPAATAAAPAAAAGDAQPTLLGQYGDWGAYTASPLPSRRRRRRSRKGESAIRPTSSSPPALPRR